MSEWIVKNHPDFLRDLDKLGTVELQNFYDKKQKIKENPERQKHLKGGKNCYREPITDNIRLIYYVEGKTIWLLTIGRHDRAYKEYLKRLYKLREKILK